MTRLDLHDIQGNIVKAYGRYGFPKGRYLLFSVLDGAAGRQFVQALAPSITTSAPWRDSGSSGSSGKGERERGAVVPEVTTNIAFSYQGMRELGVPRASLQSFPDEFAMGMRARRDILGDDGASAPEHWDPVWNGPEAVHMLIWINGQSDTFLEQRYQEIVALAEQSVALDGSPGVTLLVGHRGSDGRDDLPYQAASAIYIDGQPSAKEHFGYTDGIGDPFFKGTGSHDSNLIGGGKVTGLPPESRQGWEPLETGEFLLGYKDEAMELPEAPIPKLLSHNGTFMVYRKLHENVGSFDDYLEHVGSEYPAGKEALAAKFAGRWRNGAPLTRFPTEAEANAFSERWSKAKAQIATTQDPAAREEAKKRFSALNEQYAAFDYNDDLEGSRCPMGAHIRRANPRSALEFGQKGVFESPGALVNRRRIIRRGLPYGDSSKTRTNDGDHGIIFMAINASIRRQFEFVQQQWMNYGNDFRLANDKDPMIGNHGEDDKGNGTGHAVLQTAASDPNPTFFCSKIPRFVETRGGEYFFIPSLTALRMIGEGSIDPT
ncbi:MAG: putative Peroxidase [Myxococcaceae bacterium]|nr:putative Peroxidase [Myxococcaceae bacterium]